MIGQMTYHPYGVLNLGGESIVYKHPAPLALTGINGNSIAAEQRNVYRMRNCDMFIGQCDHQTTFHRS